MRGRGHPPRSPPSFKILKAQTGNYARAYYLQHLEMPALLKERRHRCPRREYTALAMPALQDMDARAVNPQHSCPLTWRHAFNADGSERDCARCEGLQPIHALLRHL